MPTIADVADAAHVSTATVSRALAGKPQVDPKTRQRVLDVAIRLGYVPSSAARGLATGMTRNIGVLLPHTGCWYFAHAIEGISQELTVHGYNLMVITLGTSEGRKRYFEHTMVRKQIDGLIVLGLSLEDEELEQLRKSEVPVIAVGAPMTGCAQVCVDDYDVAHTAVDHLLSLGHHKIALILGKGESELNWEVARQRKFGAEAALKEAGVEVPEPWMLEGRFGTQGGMELAERLLTQIADLPTAVFCAADDMALALLMLAERYGIQVPEQLSIIGVDDHEFAAVAGLSTVRQDPVAQGKLAAGMLLQELSGVPDALTDIVAPYELVARRSTARPS